ncbi:MAG: hypothetical protein MK008_03200 [Bdellovibrionales bacterium]|nr:hypothetical protein [Bdellovibrionales bacterium]
MKKIFILICILFCLQTQASECSIYLFDGVHFSEKLQNLVNNVFFRNSHPREQDKELVDLFTQYKDELSHKQTLKILKNLSTPKIKQKIIKTYYFVNKRSLSTPEVQQLFKELPDSKAYFNSSLKLVRLISQDHQKTFPQNKKAKRLYDRALSTHNMSDLEWRLFVLKFGH